MNIAIFCSANADIDPEYFTLTRRLGQWAAHEGHTIVFGGCNMGLMECVAKATREAGGRTIGVVPRLVEEGGRTSDHIDVLIPCDNLSDRKDMLISHSDVAVALPGGVGTLDEVFTMVASATIGYHHKRLVLCNAGDYWRPLIDLLDHLERQGMTRRGGWHQHIIVASTWDELLAALNGAS